MNILFTALLGVIICVVEAFRPKRSRFDLMFGVSAIFFLVYVLVPFLFETRDWGASEFGQTVSNSYGIVYQNPVRVAIPLCATACYVTVVLAFSLGRKPKAATILPKPSVNFSNLAGVALFALGFAALVVYIIQLGGILSFFRLGVYMRADNDAATRLGIGATAFLRNIAILTASSSFFFFVSYRLASARSSRSLSLSLLAVSFVTSMIVYFHRAGRLDWLMYLGFFAMYPAFAGRKIPIFRGLMLGAVFLFLLVFGKAIMWVAFMDIEPLDKEALSFWNTLDRFTLELIFPYASSSAALSFAGTLLPYRWFVDVPIAFINLLPNQLLGIPEYPTLSTLNTELMQSASGIPVDLVGLGIYNGGFAGVIFTGLAFGLILKWIDNFCLPRPNDPSRAALKAWLCLFIAMRVPYADPSHAIVSGFHIWIVILFYVAICYVSPRWKPRKAAVQQAADLTPGMFEVGRPGTLATNTGSN
jgi:hypothetical protein